ncbi:phosphotransferase [Shimia sp. R10_1]|uniref:phosphotransferase n=1 Tax=Shimia sp. R10_1 TaxID=2821095 RepID=UPI001AD95BD7|nr:phosphotransferase [Shimia sp. R10_1]MBO9472848.1 phosphotransferase [Shimia sp. R10_1]
MEASAHPPAHLWGISASLERLAGGHRNSVWRTVGLDRELVFKSTQRSEAAIAWVNTVQVIAREAGLHAPQMHRAQNGHWAAAGWLCEDFIAGQGLSPRDAQDLVDPLTRFHARAKDIPQRPSFLSTADLLKQDAGGDVDLSAMPADLVICCRSAWAAVQAGPATAIHGDIAAGNVLRAADGNLWLIDWDECRRDLPLYDQIAMADLGKESRRAHLAWEVACCWHREPTRARRLAENLRSSA